MAKLIKNRALANDEWVLVQEIADPQTLLQDCEQALILPLPFWLEHRDAPGGDLGDRRGSPRTGDPSAVDAAWRGACRRDRARAGGRRHGDPWWRLHPCGAGAYRRLILPAFGGARRMRREHAPDLRERALSMRLRLSMQSCSRQSVRLTRRVRPTRRAALRPAPADRRWSCRPSSG